MGKLADLTGMRFGKLVVIRRADDHISPSGARKPCWECVCDCGTRKIVAAEALTRGKTLSCGCLLRSKINIVGQKFGEWTVWSYADDRRKVNCKCSCGVERTILVWDLLHGKTKSCKNPEFHSIVGRKFNRLTVIGYAGDEKYICRCECGNVVQVGRQSLQRGDTKSCGCYKQEHIHDGHPAHGLSHTRLYHIWHSMKSRCYDKKGTNYKNYGGKGVKVCEEWLHNPVAFCEWAIANGYDENAPKGKCTIDRIDSNGDYEPSNCRFVDSRTQGNNRSTNKIVIYNGKKYTASNLARELNIKPELLLYHLRGKDIGVALVKIQAHMEKKEKCQQAIIQDKAKHS